MKKVTNKVDFIKIKNFCSTKENVKRKKDKPQMRRKYLQRCLINEYYLKYTKTAIRKQTPIF